MRARLARHTTAPQGEHLDLFLDMGEDALLETFETSTLNATPFLTGESVSFILKAPHRRLYLDYEGLISRDRGELHTLWEGSHVIPPGGKTEPLSLHLDHHRNCLVLAD